jgi:hypothetical protein
MAIGDPFGSLDTQPYDEDAELQSGLKYVMQKEAADKAAKRTWGDTLNEVAHAPGRILGSLAASPASPEADQAAMSPETFVNPLVKNTAEAVGGAIKSGVTAAHDIGTGQVPLFDEEGKPTQEGIGRVFDMASLGGGASIAGTAKAAKIAADSGKAAAPIAAAEHASPFYSGLEKFVAEHPQETMPASQWANVLANKPGVKPEEMKYTGASDMLAAKGDSPVTKKELLDHLEGNKVQIGEVTKSDMPANWKDVPGDMQHEIADRFRDITDETAHPDDLPDWYENIAAHSRDGGETSLDKIMSPPRYAGYQLPGPAENYREKLLTLPRQIENPRTGEQIAMAYGRQWEKVAPYEREQFEAQAARENSAGDYKSSHWDEPNVLAHLRMNNRDVMGEAGFAVKNKQSGNSSQVFPTQEAALDYQDRLPASVRNKTVISRAADEKPALHLEELQSDWHQAGRRSGYDDPIARAAVEKKLDQAGYPVSGEDARSAAEDGVITSAEARMLGNASYIPDAPFKKTEAWTALGLKRALHEAAETGKDRISWTPGEAQAARYDLSKHLDRIEYEPVLNDKDKPTGKYEIYAKDKNGKQVFHEDEAGLERIEQLAGKEIAQKIEQNAGSKDKSEHQSAYRNWRALTDLDLQVGGEGMRKYYDDIVRNEMNKLGKPHGVQVKQGTIESSGRTPVHYMDIPPSLKEQLLTKGMPLFEDSSPGMVAAAMDKVKKPSEAPFPQYAEAYPPVGPPKLMYKSTMKPVKDLPEGSELERRLALPKTDPEGVYWGKQNTPEAEKFQKVRSAIQKNMEKEGYEPYFDPA